MPDKLVFMHRKKDFILKVCKNTFILDGKAVNPESDYIFADTVNDEAVEFDNSSLEDIVTLMEDRGDYCMAGIKDGKSFGLTDMFGSRPIFFSADNATLTNRVALLNEGESINILPGSTIATCDKGKFAVNQFVRRPEFQGGLGDALKLSVSERVSKNDKVAVSFSGGLDSSLIAYLAKPKAKIALFTLVTEDERDDMAEKSSELLDIELHYVSADENIIKETYKASSSSILWKSPMDYALGLGFQLVAKKASEEGYSLLMAGQGADELFGGYSKYMRMENSSLSIALKNDAERLYIGAARDAEAIRDGGCTPSFPFMDERVGILAERLPLTMKVRNGQRKVALRKSAQQLGLPEKIFDAPKKAFQYSSGMQKLVEKVFF
jgi:asparagine synthase (glutamine-hydrolysing)